MNDSPDVRWEYKVLNPDSREYEDEASDFVKKANELGSKGWEFVTSTGYRGMHLIFKRRLP